MKSSKLLLYCTFFVLALFLQSCKSDSKDPGTTNNLNTPIKKGQKIQNNQRVINPKVDAQIGKVIKEMNEKIDQTDKEVNELLKGI